MYINQIIEGDSTKVLADLPEGSVDLIVTDPPYLANYRDRTGRKLANDDNPQAVLSVFAEAYRVLKPGSYCISFYGWGAIAEFSRSWQDAGFRTVGHIVWPKRYASSKGHTAYHHESAFVLVKGHPSLPHDPLPDVQEWVYSGNRRHPTEKAVEVIAPLIRCFSEPGDLVCDPFSGSGSTSVAAALNKRNYLGIDVDAAHVATATARLAGVARFQAQKVAA